jgi:uncharacterized membrane protein
LNDPKPGAMDMGDIVAGAWNIYRRAPLAWLSITALAIVAVFVAQWVLGDRLDLGPEPAAEDLQAAWPAIGASLGISALVDLFTHVALVAAAFAVIDGRRVDVGAAYRSGARLFVPALVGSLVIAIVAGLLGATLILLPLALFFFINWSLLVQVIVHEDCGPFRALGRSREIVRGQWWRTFGINLAILLLGFLPGLLIGRIASAPGETWVSALGASLGSAVAAPFVALAQTLLYLDLRARKREQPATATVGEAR